MVLPVLSPRISCAKAVGAGDRHWTFRDLKIGSLRKARALAAE